MIVACTTADLAFVVAIAIVLTIALVWVATR